jgi:hypothetical protein
MVLRRSCTLLVKAVREAKTRHQQPSETFFVQAFLLFSH